MYETVSFWPSPGGWIVNQTDDVDTDDWDIVWHTYTMSLILWPFIPILCTEKSTPTVALASSSSKNFSSKKRHIKQLFPTPELTIKGSPTFTRVPEDFILIFCSGLWTIDVKCRSLKYNTDWVCSGCGDSLRTYDARPVVNQTRDHVFLSRFYFSILKHSQGSCESIINHIIWWYIRAELTSPSIEWMTHRRTSLVHK